MMRRGGYRREEQRGERAANLFAECQGPYNYVSCVVKAFMGGGWKEEFPQFSRAAVVHAYNAPPPPGVDLKRYVEEVRRAAEGAFKAALYFEFVLETPLTIHVRWPYLPLEIGVAWHPLFNVPYVPASSLKGALRAAAAGKICGMEPHEAFGTVKHEGKLVVFDAYPVEWQKPVEPDVVTPHYKEVAEEVDETSASPTPLVYPVVPAGTKFALLIGSREDIRGCAAELLNFVESALRRGLGAKTSVGYGVFRKA
ncbi:MAG: type III-B CRISPR module RAMP protein Cmr6 [Thermoproteus sp.]